MRVAVMGTGYVGLVTGACLAEQGHRVACVDIDAAKVEQINRGRAPLTEPGLNELLQRHVGRRLQATVNARQAVSDAELTLIAVGTPGMDGLIDLGAVEAVARLIGEVLRERVDYHRIVVKSTVVPGTTEQWLRPLLEQVSGKRAGVDFGLAVNPEFLREGSALADFMQPDRLVFGAIDARSLAGLRELYRAFARVERLETSCTTAEMIKYTANALLATMISFANEMANLCPALGGVDALDVMRGVHLDRRLTPILADGRRLVPGFTDYLVPGCGFGGSCLPKDIEALTAHAKNLGQPLPLLEAVKKVNDRQHRQVLERLYRHYPQLDAVTIAVLGLAFKPDTDDVRGSPAIPIIEALIAAGAQVRTFDPAVADALCSRFPADRFVSCANLEVAVAEAEAILVLTRWAEFSQLPALLRGRDPPPLVVDGRRMLDKALIARYEGIGL